jgi:hypothetical protein
VTDHRTATGPHLAAYTYVHLLIRLGVRHFQVRMLEECTYCGGPHQRSQCPWPLVNK